MRTISGKKGIFESVANVTLRDTRVENGYVFIGNIRFIRDERFILRCAAILVYRFDVSRVHGRQNSFVPFYRRFERGRLAFLSR